MLKHGERAMPTEPGGTRTPRQSKPRRPLEGKLKWIRSEPGAYRKRRFWEGG